MDIVGVVAAATTIDAVVLCAVSGVVAESDTVTSNSHVPEVLEGVYRNELTLTELLNPGQEVPGWTAHEYE